MELDRYRKILAENIYIVLAALICAVFVFSPSVGIYGWKKELAYVDLTQDSLFSDGNLPYYWWNRSGFLYYPIIGQSGLFISYPETFLFSPLLPFLAFLKPVTFLKFMYLAHLVIGVLGVHALKKRFNWDIHQTRIFSGLFLLSPIILQHVAIGYFPWVNFFFFPLLVYFYYADNRIERISGIGGVLGVIMLQGGTHPLVWLTVFLFFISLFEVVLYRRAKRLLDLVASLFLAAALSAVRLFSAYTIYRDFSQSSYAGYSLEAFFSMTTKFPLFLPKDMDDIEQFIEFSVGGVPYWDGGTYWGPVLFIFLILFYVIFITAIKPKSRFRSAEKMILPVFLSSCMTLILSFGHFYARSMSFLADLFRLPALSGVEKYPFRFAIVAYFGFTFVLSASYPLIADGSARLFSCLSNWLEKMRWGNPGKWMQKNDIKKTERHLRVVVLLFIIMAIFWLAFGRDYSAYLINQSYTGQGIDFLEALMKHKTTIPIQAYVQKAHTLVHRFFLIGGGIITCWVLILLFLNHRMVISRFLQRIVAILLKQRHFVFEFLTILPLFAASLIWLRIAISTPMSSYPPILQEPPSVRAVYPEDAMIRWVEISSDRIAFICDAKNDLTCSIVFEIPANDQAFIRIQPRQSQLRLNNEKIYFDVSANEVIWIEIQKTRFQRLLILTCLVWAGFIYFLVRYIRIKKRRGYESESK